MLDGLMDLMDGWMAKEGCLLVHLSPGSINPKKDCYNTALPHARSLSHTLTHTHTHTLTPPSLCLLYLCIMQNCCSCTRKGYNKLATMADSPKTLSSEDKALQYDKNKNSAANLAGILDNKWVEAVFNNDTATLKGISEEDLNKKDHRGARVHEHEQDWPSQSFWFWLLSHFPQLTLFFAWLSLLLYVCSNREFTPDAGHLAAE